MKGFKIVNDFTFDDCFIHIERNRTLGVDTDKEILERYSTLLSGLVEQDDSLFSNAKSMKALQKYINSYPLNTTAQKYQLRHIEEAQIRLDKARRYQKKIAFIAMASTLLVMAMILSLVNYHPVKYLVVDDSILLSKYGDSITFSVQTNIPNHLIQMELESDGKWLRVKGLYGDYTIVAQPNLSKTRTAQIRISAPNRWFENNISWEYSIVQVTQDSGEPTFINSNIDSISLSRYGGTRYLNITTDGVLDDSIFSNIPSWCSVSMDDLTDNTYSFIVTADKNTGDRRSGDISIHKGEITKNITVYQKSGLATYISLSTSIISAPAQGYSQHIEVDTDGTSWDIINPYTWILAESDGWNDKFLHLKINENDGYERSATIIVKSNNGDKVSLVVNQTSGQASYISVNQSSLNVGIDASEENIAVNTDGKDWSVYSAPSWLKVTPYSGRIHVEIPYNSGTVRKGNIVLESNNGHRASISVKQNGNPSNFYASKSSILFDTDEDRQYIDIKKDSDLPIQVKSDVSWITGSVSGNTKVKISVDSNSSSTRHGTVSLMCGDKSCKVDVKQRGWGLCPKCLGSRRFQCPIQVIGTNGLPQLCPYCRGWGQIPCSQCDGKGRIKSDVTL